MSAGRNGQDEHVSRRSRWLPWVWGAGLAGAGAVVAFVLAGGPWAAGGAVVGAVAGAFAPSLYDGLRERGVRHGGWQGSGERALPVSRARLLDPRREVVGFVGRERELAALAAWCQDDQAGRLRLLTGPGGVGKTRLAIELADRMRGGGWRAGGVADGSEGGGIGALRAGSGGRGRR